jgi:hypothetical protein
VSDSRRTVMIAICNYPNNAVRVVGTFGAIDLLTARTQKAKGTTMNDADAPKEEYKTEAPFDEEVCAKNCLFLRGLPSFM